jgi:hypothetical protein
MTERTFKRLTAPGFLNGSSAPELICTSCRPCASGASLGACSLEGAAWHGLLPAALTNDGNTGRWRYHDAEAKRRTGA